MTDEPEDDQWIAEMDRVAADFAATRARRSQLRVKDDGKILYAGGIHGGLDVEGMYPRRGAFIGMTVVQPKTYARLLDLLGRKRLSPIAIVGIGAELIVVCGAILSGHSGEAVALLGAFSIGALVGDALKEWSLSR